MKEFQKKGKWGIENWEEVEEKMKYGKMACKKRQSKEIGEGQLND